MGRRPRRKACRSNAARRAAYRTTWLAPLLAPLLGACGTSAPTEFGMLLARTALALVAVGALAVVSLRLWARSMGAAARESATMNVVERVPIGPRQSLLAVRTGARVWIVAQTPQGIQPIGDMEWTEFADQAGGVRDARSFADVLAGTRSEEADPRAIAPPDEVEWVA